MYDYCKPYGNPEAQEIAFSVYGKDVHFVWDPSKEEWVSKELEEHREVSRQREFLIMTWAVFCITAGSIVGFCLGWVSRG